MAAVSAPVKVLIATMEASKYSTSNLVKPYIGKLIDRLSLLKSTPTNYRGRKEFRKVSSHLSPCVVIYCGEKNTNYITHIS